MHQDIQISNETEPGYFLVSSRGYRYFGTPNNNDNEPYWARRNVMPSGCKNNNSAPYWEIKIEREHLSPLISDMQDEEYAPINAYFDYEYLPTSTEYHQHYFGFEPTQSINSTFNILDGKNLTTINQAFRKESTYRIIHQGNPLDDRIILL